MNTTNSTSASARNLKRPAKERICVICEDESDGLHFGQPTCRACAAFFRRTVSQKLQYTCKREGKCEIDKGARNMCRSCRFKKCLGKGMQTSAVQNAQDDEYNNDIEKEKSTTVPQLNSPTINSTFEMRPPNIPMQNIYLGNSSNSMEQTVSTTNMMIGGYTDYKHLNRMVEGYHQFLSLRKAGFAMVNDNANLQALSGGEIPRSHFDTFKMTCKIVGNLKFDIIERFFWPFSQLPPEDKRILFHHSGRIFCNAERAFRTSKIFGQGDDRLIMPDGGYVKLSEFHLFFKDSKKVIGDPEQVARIFYNSIQYLVNNVVSHMRNIDIQEIELMALDGMFLWTDSAPEISPQTLQLALQIRNEIIIDLHKYYRSLGLSEEDVTLKTANLFLLIPKLESAVKMMLEDASISDLFNLLRIEESCKGHVVV